jgi:hypothetical protein
VVEGYDGKLQGYPSTMLRMVPLPPLRAGRNVVLQHTIPFARIDANRPHLDAMLARVADDLGGGIEAHRLGVEQGGAKDVRMVAFHP